MERHFGEVDLDLIVNVLTEKLTYGKEAANFNSTTIDNINFYGKRSYNRICRTIHQKQIWLDVRRVQY